jgi:hypothetical protein
MIEIHFSKVDSIPMPLKTTTGNLENLIMKAVTYPRFFHMTLLASFTSLSTTQTQDTTGNAQPLSLFRS